MDTTYIKRSVGRRRRYGMYRPKDWKKFQIKGSPLHCFAPEECTNAAYEAGADAMLKALRKGGAHYKKVGEARFFAGKEITQNGCLVFIPEEDMV